MITIYSSRKRERERMLRERVVPPVTTSGHRHNVTDGELSTLLDMATTTGKASREQLQLELHQFATPYVEHVQRALRIVLVDAHKLCSEKVNEYTPSDIKDWILPYLKRIVDVTKSYADVVATRHNARRLLGAIQHCSGPITADVQVKRIMCVFKSKCQLDVSDATWFENKSDPVTYLLDLRRCPSNTIHIPGLNHVIKITG